MSSLPTTQNEPCSWPITIGAEGIAAAQFARCGFDVLVQAGRDKPWYDLVVTKAGNLLKVSVKASDDGRWNLTGGYSRRPVDWGGSPLDCRGSIEMWLSSHGSRAVCCLVQFDGVAINQLPRIYLASPAEVAVKMLEQVNRLGHGTLYEQYSWKSSEGVESLEMLPSAWLFSPERIQELLSQDSLNEQPSVTARRILPASAPGPTPVISHQRLAAVAMTA